MLLDSNVEIFQEPRVDILRYHSVERYKQDDASSTEEQENWQNNSTKRILRQIFPLKSPRNPNQPRLIRRPAGEIWDKLTLEI